MLPPSKGIAVAVEDSAKLDKKAAAEAVNRPYGIARLRRLVGSDGLEEEEDDDEASMIFQGLEVVFTWTSVSLPFSHRLTRRTLLQVRSSSFRVCVISVNS